MKKSLLLGLIGFAAAVAQSHAQGLIILDNYFSKGGAGGPNVTYGEAGVPANGVSGSSGAVGGALTSGWTAGFYWVTGSPAIGADPASKPIGDPSTFTGGLTLATGTGSTAGIDTALTGFTPGQFLSQQTFAFPNGIAAGATVTLEMVAYNGSSYANSSFRGHSASFTMTVSDPTSNNPNKVGDFMPAFSVFSVPEPSVFALASLGGAFLMLIRRKK
jgi:hypothetical protein